MMQFVSKKTFFPVYALVDDCRSNAPDRSRARRFIHKLAARRTSDVISSTRREREGEPVG